MIAPYAFDNANLDGNKEAAVVPAIPTLINKLSAAETNRFKDKINEIIAVTDTVSPHLFPELRVLFKGSGNLLPTLQAGDTVHGQKDATTWWLAALYNGGDPEDRDANYTPISEWSST